MKNNFSIGNHRPALSLLFGLLSLPALGSFSACGGDSSTDPESAMESESGVEAVSPCRVEQELDPGESCSVGESDTFEVGSDGIGCLIQPHQDGLGFSGKCGNKDVEVEGFSASRIPDTDRWRIDSIP